MSGKPVNLVCVHVKLKTRRLYKLDKLSLRPSKPYKDEPPNVK